MMLYRRIPGDNRDLSILGFGCMRLPLTEEGTIHESLAEEMLFSAIDGGINYVDTAWPYHNGASEPFVGKALEGEYRKKVFLATKLPLWEIEAPQDMEKILEQQLQRLRTDHIDFYLLHNFNEQRWEHMKKMGFEKFLQKAQEQNIIRKVGFSFHDQLPLFKTIVDSYPWDFCQIQYNYLDRNYQAGTEGLLYAASKKLGVIVMEPLRGGKIVQNVPPAIQEIWNRAAIPRSPAEWGLRWLWNIPEITLVLSGMSTPEQVRENLEIASRGLPESLEKEELELVDAAAREYTQRMIYPCTSCGYCLPCPQGVRIPECLNHYNSAFMFDDLPRARFTYRAMLDVENRASACINCGACLPKCPQHISIPQALAKVRELLEE
ncbi:MAG TPA: aldo/keto reductase [Synergistaceae bacterium]|nr:aldo/keto reductase [Synergistaceae bacterium]HPJ24693.1 aldo/keto reductase [Synergistaceae bacterium]HPQ37522.1 aldo/keto reductase [Synergistaceae bacterium]